MLPPGYGGGTGHVHEHAARLLPPQRVRFLGEVGDEDVEAAAAVHVAQGDAHVALRLAQAVVREPALRRLVAERAVVPVDPQAVGLGVVGD